MEMRLFVIQKRWMRSEHLGKGGNLHSSTESSFYFPPANFLRLHITTVLELTFEEKKTVIYNT